MRTLSVVLSLAIAVCYLPVHCNCQKVVLPSKYLGAWSGSVDSGARQNVVLTFFGGEVGSVVGMEVTYGSVPYPFSCLGNYILRKVKPDSVQLEEELMFAGTPSGSSCETGRVVLDMMKDGSVKYAWRNPDVDKEEDDPSGRLDLGGTGADDLRARCIWFYDLPHVFESGNWRKYAPKDTAYSQFARITSNGMIWTLWAQLPSARIAQGHNSDSQSYETLKDAGKAGRLSSSFTFDISSLSAWKPESSESKSKKKSISTFSWSSGDGAIKIKRKSSSTKLLG